MDQLKIEYLPIEEVKPYEKNAKEHPKEQVEQIKESIRQFGMDDPIGIWKGNVVIEGHGRLMACKELGFETVPVIRLDHLTDEERKAYALIHNKTTMNSDWDFELLGGELESIVDIDMTEFGFEWGQLEDEAVDDDFEAELPEEPTSKRGDLYKLGEHRLLVGDSTILTDVERLVGGVQVDLLLTDPPYNVNYTGKTKDALKIENDQMDDNNFREFLYDAFTNADMVMKPGAVFYIWHADSEGYNFRGACHDVGWDVRQCLIWNKNTMVMGRQDYHWKHEPCLYGWKSGAGHLWASDRKQTTILSFERPNASKLHPTMKPVPLFDYQIKNNTKGGDIVLDLFGGSGTTLIACEQNGRRAFVMEYDPRYADVIIQRWEEFTGQKAELITE